MKRTSKRHKNIIHTTKPKVEKKSTKKSNFLLYGLFAGIITFIINYLFVLDNSTLLQLSINKNTFTFISLILSAIVFYSIFKVEEKLTANIAKYTFLILLLYSIAISLILIPENSKEFVFLYNKLIAYQNILMVPTIALGIITIWIHKINLQNIVNDLFSKKEPQKDELKTKERIINPIKQLFSKKEILPTSILFVIIGISIFTLFYRLDYFDLYSDEAQVTQGAAGYYYTGEYRQWDFVKSRTVGRNYNRAKPHQFIVAQSYKIFGISAWSSRFPSAIFGVLLIILSYFIGRYFVKDKYAVLLIVFSFAFYFEFLLLLRWGRMYAIVIPLFLSAFYAGYKFITGNNLLFIKKYNNRFLFSLFDFNYLYLLFFLVLIYLNYYLHINTLLILLVLYLHIMFLFILYKEKKHLIAIIFGIVFIVLGYFFVPNIKGGLERFSFLIGGDTEIYNQFFFGYPFSLKTNLITLLTGVAVLFFVRNDKFIKSYIYLGLTVTIGWFLFVYIIKHAVSFRYMSFIAPISIFLIVGVFIIIAKTLYNRVIQFFLALLLLLSVIVQFSFRYNDLYVKNFASPARPSIAWKTIVKDCKKSEIVYRHWGPSFYFKGTDTTATFLEIGGYKGKPFNEILDTLKNYKSGWLTWHTQHAWRMDSLLNEYANLYFKKHHGYGVDNTGVEVFQYADSMLVDSNQFYINKRFPFANLNLQNKYSVAFWLKINLQNDNPPLLFKENNMDIVTLNLNAEDESFQCFYNNKDFIKGIQIADNKWHHVVWYQEGGAQGSKFGIFIDGSLKNVKELQSEITGLVKFSINLQFNGGIDDIRIYDFVLNKYQIQQIIKNRGVKNTEELFSDNRKFKTLFHWQKN